jgi:hypothetical protein
MMNTHICSQSHQDLLNQRLNPSRNLITIVETELLDYLLTIQMNLKNYLLKGALPLSLIH